jgi:hypothetical protein
MSVSTNAEFGYCLQNRHTFTQPQKWQVQGSPWIEERNFSRSPLIGKNAEILHFSPHVNFLLLRRKTY